MDFEQYFFQNCLKSYIYQSPVVPVVLTIPKWYNIWVLKIFLEIFLKILEKKIQKNIFEKNIYKKYFQYPSVIPFWNRETQCNAMALIEIWFRAIWKKIFFKIQRGGPLVQKKRFLLCRGVNFVNKNSAFLEVSQI